MRDFSLKEKTGKRKYLRYDEACGYYGVSRNTLQKWVEESGAARKIEKVILINTEKVDEYIETFPM